MDNMEKRVGKLEQLTAELETAMKGYAQKSGVIGDLIKLEQRLEDMGESFKVSLHEIKEAITLVKPTLFSDAQFEKLIGLVDKAWILCKWGMGILTVLALGNNAMPFLKHFIPGMS